MQRHARACQGMAWHALACHDMPWHSEGGLGPGMPWHALACHQSRYQSPYHPRQSPYHPRTIPVPIPLPEGGEGEGQCDKVVSNIRSSCDKKTPDLCVTGHLLCRRIWPMAATPTGSNDFSSLVKSTVSPDGTTTFAWSAKCLSRRALRTNPLRDRWLG